MPSLATNSCSRGPLYIIYLRRPAFVCHRRTQDQIFSHACAVGSSGDYVASKDSTLKQSYAKILYIYIYTACCDNTNLLSTATYGRLRHTYVASKDSTLQQSYAKILYIYIYIYTACCDNTNLSPQTHLVLQHHSANLLSTTKFNHADEPRPRMICFLLPKISIQKDTKCLVPTNHSTLKPMPALTLSHDARTLSLISCACPWSKISAARSESNSRLVSSDPCSRSMRSEPA